MARFNNEKNELEELKKEVVRKFPSLGAILNNLQMRYSRRLSTAATNGNAVYFNPDFLAGLSHGEKIGTMAHEVMHVAFRHIPRLKNKNPELWNIATDAVINSMIKEADIPLPEGCIDIPDAKDQSAEEVYKDLVKKYKDACEKRKEQNGQEGQGDNNKQQSGQGQARDQQQAGDKQGQAGNQQGEQGENGQQSQDGSKQGQQQGRSGQQGAQGQQGQNQNGGQQGEQRQQRDRSQMESGSASGKQEVEQTGSDQSSGNEDSLDGENGLPIEKGKLDQEALRDVLGNNSLPQNHQVWNKAMKKIEKKEKKNGKNGQDENDDNNDERSELNKFKQDDKPQNQQYGNKPQNFNSNQRDDSVKASEEFDDESENQENNEDFDDEFEEAEPNGDEGEDQNKLDENADYGEMERNFSQENKNIRREKAEEIRRRLKSEAQQSGVGDDAYYGNFGAVGEARAALSWKQILKREFEKEESRWGYRRASRDNYYSARIQDMEDFDQPATEVCLDTSGSIDDDLLKGFLRQLKTIIKQSKLRVGCFSDEFYGFTEIKSNKDIDNFHFVGRGGTNLDSALMAFSRDKRVNKIIFTDGYDCSYPRTNNNIDCIWLVFDNPNFKAASGKVVYVERKLMYDRDDSQSIKIDDDDENYL